MTSHWIENHALHCQCLVHMAISSMAGELPAHSCWKLFVVISGCLSKAALTQTFLRWDVAFSTFGIPRGMHARTSCVSKRTPSMVDDHWYICVAAQTMQDCSVGGMFDALHVGALGVLSHHLKCEMQSPPLGDFSWDYRRFSVGFESNFDRFWADFSRD